MHLDAVLFLHRSSIRRWFVELAVLAALAVVSATTASAQAEPAEGQIQCVLFAGEGLALVSGASVSIDGGAAVQTDARGSAFLTAMPGKHAIRIDIPTSLLPVHSGDGTAHVVSQMADVPVVADDITRVLVTLSADGKLENADVRAPKEPAPVAPAAAVPVPAPSADQGTAPSADAAVVGSVSGRVTAESGKPIVGVKIIVVGADAEAQSDQDGRFTLSLPEGSYSVSILHPDYNGQTLEGVMVAVGETNEIAIALTPAPAEMEDYVVKGVRIRGTVATMMQERRDASAVTDSIGVEDIRKSPDGTASAATRRMVGATVVGGQFLFVRGLGGRYSSVRLNGVPLPSTDPDLPGFQLDLFPASLLSSLTIAKTFTPDIPGDFAGGSMNIATRDFPQRFDLSASVQLGSDTQTFGRKALSYAGGKTDFLGFDDGTRKLPSDVPNEQVRRQDNRGGLPPDQIAALGRSFPNRWELKPTTALPNLALGLSVGDTTKIAGHRFGYLVTLGYRYSWNRYDETITNVKTQNDPKTGEKIAVQREKLQRGVGAESAQIGALATASYELAKGHDLTAVSVLTQTGDDKTALITGTTESEGKPVRQTQFAFVERQLFFNQLLGKHDLSKVLLDWQLNVANIKRNQPDLRNLLYAALPGQPFQYTNNSAERIYTDLGQTDFGGGANVTVPIDTSRLKAGYLGRVSDQDFSARRFRQNFGGSSDVRDDAFLEPEALFVPSNSGKVWTLDEKTLNTDGYTAGQQLHAGYGLADVAVVDWLRLTGGARLESFHQTIDVAPPIELMAMGGAAADDNKHTKRTDTDVLPSGGAIFNLSDNMSVRLAYGGTVARPLVRELAPFLNQDFVRRRTVTGNPDLNRTYIHNFDVRWELFPGKTEVLAASVFYKIFEDPIEAVVQDGNGDLSYQNIESAHNYGFELEARASLERISRSLRDFTAQANFALIRSRIALSEAQQMTATSRQRPMAGQSPYVANLSLGYSPADTGLSLNVFYNVYGPRIAEVGINRLPDVYEQAFHSLDFTASYQLGEHWTLGLSATNLLFQQLVFDQGGFDFSRINKGALFALRLGVVN